MKTKRAGTVVLIIINIILFGITILYYKLLKYQLYTFSLHHWIQKVFQKNIDVYSIIYDRRVEYIIITVMFGVLFTLFCKSQLIKSNKTKKILSCVMSILYTSHMFISDTLINYRSYSGQYRELSDLTFGEFAISKIWNDSISKYGFWIIPINAAFMFLLIFIFSYIKTSLRFFIFEDYMEEYDSDKMSLNRARTDNVVTVDFNKRNE